ncbi:hypothetical protein KR009_010060 [Drosophila setifemur]|nr:hypothetical protein KR009_010060 [Drosophila setifemur]
MNIPIYQLPSVSTQSLCQQSMYQQTYLDRNRMVTDVFVQEQVSQSSCSWTLAAPTQATIFVPATTVVPPPPPSPPLVPNPPVQHTLAYMAYVAMPGVQYYTTSSASMNAYGQGHVYSARTSASASCNMAGYYAPQYYQKPNGVPAPQKQFCATQTQTPSVVKSSCDVGIQVDLLISESGLKKSESGVTNNKDSSSEIKGAGDGLVVQNMMRNSEVMLLPQRLHDITRVSLQGSEIAERLANTHRNRPCFKKIDTLCARLKQDLLRPDGVLPNINSQGIAWAVKDFIFVFTRIVNAWVILKGYVYNTPDGLNKIKDELPRGFMSTFDTWQCGTLSLVDMIIKSFVKLDEMLQKQKNCFVGKDSLPAPLNSNNSSSSLRCVSECNDSGNLCQHAQGSVTTSGHSGSPPHGPGQGPNAFSTPKTPNGVGKPYTDAKDQLAVTNTSTALQKPKCGVSLNYLYTMIEDSEETQRHVDAHGTYLKTGTYQPLQKEGRQLEIAPPKSREQRFAESQTHSQTPNQLQWKGNQKQVQTQESRLAPSARLEAEKQFDARSIISPLNVIGRELSRQLYEFSDRIMELQHLERFFQKRFTRNYYPDFCDRCQDYFIDVRAVILQCESATYKHLHQAIHDLRRITYVGRSYLQINANENLQHYIDLYERSVNEMLSKSPHVPNQFDHIEGRPGEKLYNYDI